MLEAFRAKLSARAFSSIEHADPSRDQANVTDRRDDSSQLHRLAKILPLESRDEPWNYLAAKQPDALFDSAVFDAGNPESYCEVELPYGLAQLGDSPRYFIRVSADRSLAHRGVCDI